MESRRLTKTKALELGIMAFIGLVLFFISIATLHAQTKVVQGPQGPRGFTGARGPAATVQIGTVTVVDANTPPSVTNVGTSTNAIFNFAIPRGGQILSGAGAPGAGGAAGDWYFDTTNACLYGPKTTLWPAVCTNLVTTVAVGTTTTLPSGSSATVTNSGTPAHPVLDFGIPTGSQGPQGPGGPQGPSGTIAVGAVTTLPAGSLATVQNSGNNTAATFDFGIPTGPQGPQGPPGGSLTGVTDVTTTIQAAVDTACAASPHLAVHIPGNWNVNETFTNTCNAYVWDQRSALNQGSGVFNVKNYGADGTGNGYVSMVTNSASKNITGCYNMTASQVVGKYLHVLRAGPGGTIFKSLITAFSGTTCTVADFPSASVTAGGWVSSNDDDSPSFNAAASAVAANGGGKIVIPPGRYYLQSPLTIPVQQTTIAPWSNAGIEIECPGGPKSTQLFGVQNSLADTAAPMAIISGPRTTVTVTGWSQTGTSVTLNANNNFVNGDFISVWVPSGVGTINGAWVITRTATTIMFTVATSQTVSYTETGTAWRAENPMTPWIHGCDFETLDYPYGGKTGTTLVDGIDMKAYVFKVDDNWFGNLDEGIRMYQSWLGKITNNRFYGPDQGIHFPPNLGPVNATLVGWNWLDAYGKYGINAEANQQGGSYGNQYLYNETEGTSAKTLADIKVNGGGITFHSGYDETTSNWTNEATYHQLINSGYGKFEFTYPYCMKSSGAGGNVVISNGSISCELDHFVQPTLSVNAGAGTFPAGRDVYVRLTLKDPVTPYETPYYTGTDVTAPKITNTALNDQVQVTASNWTDSTATLTQYCVYESDVATGAAVPNPETFRFVACTAKGSPTLIGAAPTSGAYLKPVRAGWDQASGGNNIFIGGNPQYDSSRSYSTTLGWYAEVSNNIYFGPTQLIAPGIETLPYLIGTIYDWAGGRGAVRIAGRTWSSSNAANVNPNYPTQFGTKVLIPAGTIIQNSYFWYAPAAPLDHNLFFVCKNNAGCSANPLVASDWLKVGYGYSVEHSELVYTPSTTTVTGDIYWQLSPATWGGLMGWYTYAGGAGGGTNYPFSTAGNLLLQSKAFNATPVFDPSTVAGGSTQGDSYKNGGNYFKMTLTGNVTSSTFQNGLQGHYYVFEICQNSTGGYTFAWPTQFKGAGVVSPVASTCSIQAFAYDGTNVYAVSNLMDQNGNSMPTTLTVAKRIASNLNSLTFSATPAFDASTANTFKMTLTANVTSSTLTNAVSGQPLNFVICQDGTGNWTFSWPTSFKGAMTIGTTASTCNAQSFIWDGTNAWATSQGKTNQ